MNHNQRLQRDARLLAGDPEAAAIFDCLAEHLFDPALDITFLGRVCGASRAVRDRLAARIGPLKDYVTELRMTEAARLVRETPLPIIEISRTVGYPVIRTFRRAFAKAHGITPSEMRRQARSPTDAKTTDDSIETPDHKAVEDTANEPVLANDDQLSRRALARRLCRRCELGRLDPQAAEKLRRQLRQLYPQLDDTDASSEPEMQRARRAIDNRPIQLTPTTVRLERIAAETAIRQILDLPPAEQRFALLEGLTPGNLTVLYELFRICRELATRDPDNALRIARLGVEMTEPRGQAWLEEFPRTYKSLAWIHFSRVQVIAGDLGGAEQSLQFAVVEVGSEDRLNLWLEQELRWTEGSLRRRQRRYDDSQAALERARALSRRLRRWPASRPFILLSCLELASIRGDSTTAFEVLEELEAFFDSRGESPTLNWRGLIRLHRAKAQIAAGQTKDAEHGLREAITDFSTDSESDSDPQIGNVFAAVLHQLGRLLASDHRLDEAAALLRQAADRYRGFESAIPAVAVEAELSVVCALLDRPTEARRLATSAAEFFEGLPSLHREAWQAAHRLRTLANVATTAPEDELKAQLMDLQRELDLAMAEITDPHSSLTTEPRWHGRVEA